MEKRPKVPGYDHLFKVMLIGDSKVGKTSIMNCFSDSMFSMIAMPTIGIDFKIRPLDLNGKRIKLQIWDTAGQERFQTITSSYYRGAMAIMLVYDVTCLESFKNVAKWMRNIDENAKEDVIKFIVGNKCDMADEREVAMEAGMKVANQYGVRFIETSAKTNRNISEVFIEVATLILEQVGIDLEIFSTIKLFNRNFLILLEI
jgi:small GTP-binding protein